MQKIRNKKTYNTVMLAVFFALVLVLQFFAENIKIGTISITLALIPIVLAGCLLGWREGAILGGFFGVVVVVFSILGMDVGGQILFQLNPALTVLVCLVKGIACGLFPAILFQKLKHLNFTLAVFLSAILSPIANTGLFTLAMLTVFRDTLTQWAGGKDTLVYVFTGLLGVNFLIEFAVNVLLSPVIATVLKSLKAEPESRNNPSCQN